MTALLRLVDAPATRSVLATAGVAGALVLAVRTAPFTGVAEAVAGLLLAGSFLVCGVIAWGARPGDRTGPLLVACGLGLLPWQAAVLRSEPALASVSWALHNLWEAVLIHSIVTFPGGRLRTRSDRWLVGAVYAFCGPFTVLVALATSRYEDCDRCSGAGNPFHVEALGGVEAVLGAINLGGVVLLALCLVATMLRRWRSSTPPSRRVLRPLYLTILAAVVVEVGWNTAFAAGTATPGDDVAATTPLSDLVTLLYSAVFAVIPLGFLAGTLRTAAQVRVGALLTALAQRGEGSVRDVLADALGDPTLRLAYRRAEGEGWVDAAGRPVARPAPTDTVHVRLVAGTGSHQPLAALLHDPALRDDPGLVETVAAAARLALENERLQADVRAQLVAVRESRRRLVEAGDRARRKIERDLHDGAQQRLVGLSIALSLAREDAELAGAPTDLLDRAAEEAQAAIDELRELAGGVHPQVLASEGLPAALRGLAARAPVPVTVDADDVGRLPDVVEVAAYFIVSEALANTAKHARAERAEVVLRREGDALVVAVGDDGAGGADAGGGGLRGLADRAEALGGTLRLDSPLGAGTRVQAVLPVASVDAGLPAGGGGVPVLG